MPDTTLDPRQELETIRGLMERAREYRHPPAAAGFLAGFAAIAGGLVTQSELSKSPVDLTKLGAVWGGVFAVAFVGVVVFTSRAARQEGKAFWSPLARDVVHALWPPLVAALALSFAVVRVQHVELVAPIWLLAYGVGGIAAGAFASPIVRALGLTFLAAGLADLALELPPGLVLAATLGGFHVVYGAILALRRRGGDER
jgi:hypothetical protein